MKAVEASNTVEAGHGARSPAVPITTGMASAIHVNTRSSVSMAARRYRVVTVALYWHGAPMSDVARDAFVDGRWVAGSRRFAARDPFDGALVAEVTDADDALIDAAVAAAARAFASWRAKPAPERGALLHACAARM